MFKVGDKVDCSLTGIPGREGLWCALYPGEVVDYNPIENTYQVKLRSFITIFLEEHRLFKQRSDRYKGEFKGGERVQVLEDDCGVPVWWEAVVSTPVQQNDSSIVVKWKGSYKRVLLSWVDKSMIRLQKQPPQVVCTECDEVILNNKSFFHEFRTCAECFVETKVDSLLDQLDDFVPLSNDKEDTTRFEQLKKYVLLKRLFILQTGGSSKVKDERLFNQLKRGLEQLQELLPEEHEDEEEWSPSYSSEEEGEEEEEEEEFISQKKQRV